MGLLALVTRTARAANQHRGQGCMNDALFDSPGKLLLTDREPSEPPRHRQRADIEAQGKCLAVLQRAGHVVHVGKSGT